MTTTKENRDLVSRGSSDQILKEATVGVLSTVFGAVCFLASGGLK
jgi:hypothetical protein